MVLRNTIYKQVLTGFYPYLRQIKGKIVTLSSYTYVSPTVPAMADHCTTGDLKIIKRTDNGLGETRKVWVLSEKRASENKHPFLSFLNIRKKLFIRNT